MLDGELAGEDGATPSVAVVEDFEEGRGDPGPRGKRAPSHPG